MRVDELTSWMRPFKAVHRGGQTPPADSFNNCGFFRPELLRAWKSGESAMLSACSAWVFDNAVISVLSVASRPASFPFGILAEGTGILHRASFSRSCRLS